MNGKYFKNTNELMSRIGKIAVGLGILGLFLPFYKVIGIDYIRENIRYFDLDDLFNLFQYYIEEIKRGSLWVYYIEELRYCSTLKTITLIFIMVIEAMYRYFIPYAVVSDMEKGASKRSLIILMICAVISLNNGRVILDIVLNGSEYINLLDNLDIDNIGLGYIFLRVSSLILFIEAVVALVTKNMPENKAVSLAGYNNGLSNSQGEVYCSVCGKLNSASNFHCKYCGADIKSNIQKAQPAQPRQQGTISQYWICGKCGTENADSAKFCARCGEFKG